MVTALTISQLPLQLDWELAVIRRWWLINPRPCSRPLLQKARVPLSGHTLHKSHPAQPRPAKIYGLGLRAISCADLKQMEMPRHRTMVALEHQVVSLKPTVSA